MKKIYLLAAGIFALNECVSAAPGDTTIVQAHNNTELSWYNNYDQLVTFPNGSLSYQKIVMEFEMGKYNCGGNYNPANPGEGAGQTGWCADWDYDVHVIACKANGDTIKLGELITPYANTQFPRFPWSWKHSYMFDVTDYYPILTDDITLRIFYSGYSGGFTGSIKFHFVEGIPPRNVVKVSDLWHGSFKYGDTTDKIEDRITPVTETFPANAVSAETKVIITGHGGDNTQNCAEFCAKWYQFLVNGGSIVQHTIWRDDCGANQVYPQSGTWPIDRANWCPGDQVRPIIHKMPSSITPGQNFDVHMAFQPYISGNNSASYKMAATMFYYGAFNHAIDAAVEDIISPTNNIAYIKNNPICGSPEIKIKNYGGSTITSVKIEYGIDGGAISSYTWNGTLASLEETIVNLPELSAIREVTGNNNKFIVSIKEVNGGADENIHNNTMRSTFTGTPIWNGGAFVLNVKKSSTAPFGGGANNFSWKIYDYNNSYFPLEQNSNNMSNGAETNDTLRMGDGCYKLVVETPKGYGLTFFSYITTRGFVRMIDVATGNRLAMEDADLGASGLEGNFGDGFVHYFRVANSTNSVKDNNKLKFELEVYPNPASNILNVAVYGNIAEKASVKLVNLVGQTVYTQETTEKQLNINTTHLVPGLYTLYYQTGDVKKVEKVIISK